MRDQIPYKSCPFKQYFWDNTKPMGHEITGVQCMKQNKIMTKNNICNGNINECQLTWSEN